MRNQFFNGNFEKCCQFLISIGYAKGKSVRMSLHGTPKKQTFLMANVLARASGFSKTPCHLFIEALTIPFNACYF